VTVQKQPSGTAHAYNTTQASFYPAGTLDTAILGGGIGDSNATLGPLWIWTDSNAEFTTGATTNLTFLQPTPTAPAGRGDITDPEAWQDAAGNIPALQYNNVPVNQNFPLNGDGRYWFSANASNTSAGGPISFIGSASYLVGNVNLQCSVLQTATDGSGLNVCWSTGSGTWSTETLLPQLQLAGLQTNNITIPLSGATQFEIQVVAQGGTASSTAAVSQVAIAITRNETDVMPWDWNDPFDPIGYNAPVIDNAGVPTDTLADLRYRILVRLGFAVQASNPPPGMTALINDFLFDAQSYLHRRYLQLHTKRLFRWKVNPGLRFYSFNNSDENVTEGVFMDPQHTVEWAGIQDLRNVWYPLIQGIPPQLYTMITKPWRPARYEIKNGIELYPVPDQTYFLWMKGHFGLMPFTLDTQSTTIDSNLVFLHALANAKAHYGHPDANNIEAQANAYRAELIAMTHQTAHYLPGTIAVPPAVRPTLIQFDANNGGGS
jgi:hypothetical protein